MDLLPSIVGWFLEDPWVRIPVIGGLLSTSGAAVWGWISWWFESKRHKALMGKHEETLDRLERMETRLIAEMRKMVGKPEPEQRRILEQVLHMTGSAELPTGTVLGNLKDREPDPS